MQDVFQQFDKNLYRIGTTIDTGVPSNVLAGSLNDPLDPNYQDPDQGNQGIQTTVLGISGNDLNLFDNSIGGSGFINGDTATINFIRADDNTKQFNIQKRKGKTFDQDNVFEMFFTAPTPTRHNFIFIGRDGIPNLTSLKTGNISFAVNVRTAELASTSNGAFGVGVYLDDSTTSTGTNSYSLLVGDGRFVGLAGSCAVIQGFDGGLSGIAYNNAIGLYQISTSSVALGLSLIPDTDNTYDIGSASFRIRDLYIGGSIQGGLPGFSAQMATTGSKGDFLVVGTLYPSNTAGAITLNFGTTAANNQVKGGMQLYGAGISFSTINLGLAKVGTPSDNATFRIETDNAGAPSGTLADANATGTIAGSSLTPGFVDTTITFAGAFTLTLGTKYWIVIGRSGTLSDTNYYSLGGANLAGTENTISLEDTISLGSRFNGTNWITANAYDHVPCLTTTGFVTAGLVKNQVATFRRSAVGFASKAYTAGDTIIIHGKGSVTDSLTGLVPGVPYTGSVTPGGITSGLMASSVALIAITSSTAYVTLAI